MVGMNQDLHLRYRLDIRVVVKSLEARKVTAQRSYVVGIAHQHVQDRRFRREGIEAAGREPKLDVGTSYLIRLKIALE
jgi:hypothetical protein